jgi:hypothetical protein
MPEYTRFWDVYLTHSNGWCDFATEIEYAGSRQTSSKPGVMTTHKSLVDPAYSLVPRHLGSKPTPPKLPNQGVTSSAVSLVDVEAKQESEDIKRLVAWVNHEEHVGKVRFNAHGLAGGKVLMPAAANSGLEDVIQAQELVHWLCKNGLKQEGLVHWGRAAKRSMGMQLKGLVTICLDFCHAGKVGGRQSNILSAIDQVAGALKAANLYSIRVTGCAEPVAIRPTPEQNRQEVRLLLRALDGLGEADLRREVKELLAMKELNTSQAQARGVTCTPNMVDTLPLDMLKELVKDLEGLLFALKEDKYGPPDARDSRPGQWGKVVEYPDGSERWFRLAKTEGKLFKDS